MSTQKIDWVIHNVAMADTQHEMLGNAHTHGLDSHGHRELCIVLNLEPVVTGGILNNMGAAIAFYGKTFSEGICADVLQQGYNIELKSLEDDPVLYVILPDEDNSMPSDKDCAYPYNMQYEYMKLISEYTKTIYLH